MLKSLIKTLCGGIIIVAGATAPGFGDTFTFDFTKLTYNANNTSDQSSAVQSVLQGQLQTVCPACTVTVLSGSKAGNSNTLGVAVDRTYNGEGYTVGPTHNFNVISETLGDTPANATITGNSDYNYNQLNNQGYTNNFLANTTDKNSNQISNEIVLQFGGLNVVGASFNYEVFPDNGSQGTADFVFQAGNNTNGVDAQIFHTLGMTPSSSGTDGSSTHSPNSTVFGNESNVQYIGNYNGSFASATELDFVDWPATIGIDNLSISYTKTTTGGQGGTVPEPTSVVLLGTAALIVASRFRHIAQRTR